MEKETYNATEITDVIIKAIEGDPSLSKQMVKIDAMVIATTDDIIAATDVEHTRILKNGGRILLVQVWSQSSRVSLVAVRRLSEAKQGLPWSIAKVEYAIDWASELSLSGATPLFAHIVEGGHDEPVFFNHNRTLRAEYIPKCLIRLHESLIGR